MPRTAFDVQALVRSGARGTFKPTGNAQGVRAIIRSDDYAKWQLRGRDRQGNEFTMTLGEMTGPGRIDQREAFRVAGEARRYVDGLPTNEAKVLDFFARRGDRTYTGAACGGVYSAPTPFQATEHRPEPASEPATAMWRNAGHSGGNPTPTFREAIESWIAGQEGLTVPKNYRRMKAMMLGRPDDGGRKGFKSVLEPLHHLPVTAVTKEMLQDALRPIWHGVSNSTDSNRLRAYAEHTFRDAGIPDDRNPATLRQMLAGPGKLNKMPLVKRSHPSMPFAQAPAYYRGLDISNPEQRLVAFYMLTAGGPRLTPYINARWSEIDLAAKTWTVAGSFTKAGKMQLRRGVKPEPFVIPLSDAAVKVLGTPGAPGALVFAGPEGGKLYNVNTGRDDCDMHGLRGTFRSWAQTQGPGFYWASEAALHHGQAGKRNPNGGRVGNEVYAYCHHDWLPERAALLKKWADLLA